MHTDWKVDCMYGGEAGRKAEIRKETKEGWEERRNRGREGKGEEEGEKHKGTVTSLLIYSLLCIW